MGTGFKWGSEVGLGNQGCGIGIWVGMWGSGLGIGDRSGIGRMAYGGPFVGGPGIDGEGAPRPSVTPGTLRRGTSCATCLRTRGPGSWETEGSRRGP